MFELRLGPCGTMNQRLAEKQKKRENLINIRLKYVIYFSFQFFDNCYLTTITTTTAAKLNERNKKSI